MTQEMETLQETPPATPPSTKKGRTGMAIRIGGAIALLAALLAVGAIPRLARQREVLAAVGDSSVVHPVVSVVQPKLGEPSSELTLPGNVEPLYSASIYARASGYVDRRTVDIGSHVKSGELLALISSPELDQQLLQARAAVAQSEAALKQATAGLSQAKANSELARLTKERDLPLGQQRAISAQVVDEAVQAYEARLADVAAAEANIAVANANISASRANVARLEQMQGFERVVAPFGGVITERNVERGDLVNAGSANAGKPLFAIAQSDTLRIQVDVPQSEAVGIRNGQKAILQIKEREGRDYTGVVSRSSGSLDRAARTMLTEVQVDNKDGSLLPGMYAQVKFTLGHGRSGFLIPTSSLIIDGAGIRVATLSAAHNIHFVPVGIGRDLGTQTEIVAGLNLSDSLVLNPSDLLKEGQTVEVR